MNLGLLLLQKKGSIIPLLLPGGYIKQHFSAVSISGDFEKYAVRAIAFMYHTT